MTATLIRALVALACLSWFGTTNATETVEEGRAQIIPWSGYWWPHHEGAMLKPLGKYDQLTGSQAAAWEREHHPPGDRVPRWHGYCHAWAASAMMEGEPAKRRFDGHPSRPIELRVGDQKGLLAVCHALDVANSYGDRYGDGEGSEDQQDLPPDTLWWLLKLYIKQQGVPLILDVEAGEQVWNYPIYAYRIEHQAEGRNGARTASLSLWMADNAVPPDYVGIKVRRESYRFAFQQRNHAVVMGSGKWLGPSRQDHPDFAWYPFVPRAENPEIDYAVVKRLVEAPPDPPQPEPQPATEPRPKPTPKPQPHPEAKPQPKPTPAPEPVPKPTPKPQPEPKPEPEPKPAARPKPEPKPEAEPAPQPKPATDPAPKTQPQLKLSPNEDLDNPSRPFAPPAPDGGQPLRVTVLSPLELVAMIARKTSDFGLDVTVDRFDGGLYEEGDTLSVRVTCDRSGYLYLLYVDSQGTLSLLYPQPAQDNRVVADQEVLVPAPSDDYVIRLAPPFGTARIKAVVCSRPLALTGLLSVSHLQATQQGTAAWSHLQTQNRHSAVLQVALLQGFRWHPTQRQLIRRLMLQYQQKTKLDPEQYGQIDPAEVLGRFAQDEVAFYIGPKKGT